MSRLWHKWSRLWHKLFNQKPVLTETSCAAITENPGLQTFVNMVLLSYSPGISFRYLAGNTELLLSMGCNSIPFRREEWSSVVDLVESLFGTEVVGFKREMPRWQYAGILSAEICIQQCTIQEEESNKSGVIFNQGRYISPTRPHEYLGYAKLCFNSGLSPFKIFEEGIMISKEEWLACQRNLKHCKIVAEQLKSYGQELLTRARPQVTDNTNEPIAFLHAEQPLLKRYIDNHKCK